MLGCCALMFVSLISAQLVAFKNAPYFVPIFTPLLLCFPSVSLTFSPLGFSLLHPDTLTFRNLPPLPLHPDTHRVRNPPPPFSSGHHGVLNPRRYFPSDTLAFGIPPAIFLLTSSRLESPPSFSFGHPRVRNPPRHFPPDTLASGIPPLPAVFLRTLSRPESSAAIFLRKPIAFGIPPPPFSSGRPWYPKFLRRHFPPWHLSCPEFLSPHFPPDAHRIRKFLYRHLLQVPRSWNPIL